MELIMFCFVFWFVHNIPDSKVHRANMGPIWGRQDPGGTHVGPMNVAIWDQLLMDRVIHSLIFLTIALPGCYMTGIK